ncbi:DUF6446 family protein [Halovulum sp. GXIMD14793]
MSGRILAGGMVIFAAVFAAALWYFQIYAYYLRVDGLTSVSVQGRDIAVQDYTGIDADTSPNKLRGCFKVDPAAFEGVPLAKDPEPLVAPGWFDCFDAHGLSADIEAGKAVAYLAADETQPGAQGYEIHRMIAVYPDGRAYMWRHYREN